MPFPVSVPDELNEDQLYRYLNLMITKVFDKLQEKNDKLQLNDEDKKDLADSITKNIFYGKDRDKVSREAFELNPNFIHKLTMALVMTVAAKKHPNLSDKLDGIKKLFEEKNIKNEDDLQKKLTPAELKQVEEIQKELREFNKECLAELKELNLIRPKPDASGKTREEEVEKTFDINTNLLGAINTKELGGLQAVIQTELGNLFGIPKLSPNYESDETQISEQTKTLSIFGDSQGLNEIARINFEALNIPDRVDEVHTEYRIQESMKPHFPTG